MKVDMLFERYDYFLHEVKLEIINAVKKHGGSVTFVSEDDPRLQEIDDLDELELPLVDAFSYNFSGQNSYYVTSIKMDSNCNLTFNGVHEQSDTSLEDEVAIYYISLYDLICILEKIPE